MGVPSERTSHDPNGQVFTSVFMQTGSSNGFREHALFPGKYVQWVVVMEVPSTSGPRQYPIVQCFIAVITAFISGDAHAMWIWCGYHASVSGIRYAFVVPPLDPLDAHIDIAHAGPDNDGEPCWEVKNIISERPGQNDLTRFDSGRYHMVSDAAENLHGHATQEELLVEKK